MMRRAPALLGCLLLALSAATAVASEPKEWDQKKLLKLTDTLVLETKRIHKEMIQHIPEDIPVGGDSSIEYVILLDASFIHTRMLALNGLIRAGSGRTATEPVLRRIQDGIDNAKEDSKDFAPLRLVRNHIKRVDELLAQVEEYY